MSFFFQSALTNLSSASAISNGVRSSRWMFSISSPAVSSSSPWSLSLTMMSIVGMSACLQALQRRSPFWMTYLPSSPLGDTMIGDCWPSVTRVAASSSMFRKRLRTCAFETTSSTGTLNTCLPVFPFATLASSERPLRLPRAIVNPPSLSFLPTQLAPLSLQHGRTAIPTQERHRWLRCPEADGA